MNVSVKQIWPAGLSYRAYKSVGFSLIAFVLAGFLASAQAQYYYLPDLPVYWGPYPPKFAYAEPYDASPGDRYSHSRRFHKYRYGGISIRVIEGELAGQGYHLIAPVRRKGNNYLCVAADAEGRRERFVFNAFSGKLVTRVSVGTGLNRTPPAIPIPAPTKDPSRSENLKASGTDEYVSKPKPDGSSPETSAPKTPGPPANTSNRAAEPSTNPSEPVSSKPAATDPPRPQSGQI